MIFIILPVCSAANSIFLKNKLVTTIDANDQVLGSAFRLERFIGAYSRSLESYLLQQR